MEEKELIRTDELDAEATEQAGMALQAALRREGYAFMADGQQLKFLLEVVLNQVLSLKVILLKVSSLAQLTRPPSEEEVKKILEGLRGGPEVISDPEKVEEFLDAAIEVSEFDETKGGH